MGPIFCLCNLYIMDAYQMTGTVTKLYKKKRGNNMKKRRLMATLMAAAVLGSSLAGCGSSSSNSANNATSQAASESKEEKENSGAAPSGEVIEISLADAQPDGCAANISLKAMAEEINEKSGGSIKVTYYPNSQLGNERDLAEGVMAGTVDMVYVSAALMQNFEPKISIFALPFIFKDYDHVHAFATGELGQEVFGKVESTCKVKVLGLFDQGFRWIWTSNKEIKTMEDLAGLKMRTPESDVYTKTFELLGTNPTPMAFGDLFTALQTGVVDGYEVNPESTWSNGTYEAIKYGLKSNHMFASSVVIISQSVFDRLDDEQKAIVLEAADNAVALNDEIAQSSEVDYENKLIEAGLIINDLSAEEQQKFAEVVQPLYEEYYDIVGGKDFVDKVHNLEY